MRSLSPFILAASLSLAFSACSCESDMPAAGCATEADCADGQSCVAGNCTTTSSGDGGEEDAGSAKDGGANIRDPNNANKDTDCDGLSDAEEFSRTYGTARRKTDPDNPDSDGDGISDGLELGRTGSVAAACAFVADADPASQTDPTRADTDADGLADGVEDRNRDGLRDPSETDPLRADTDSDLIPDPLEDRNGDGVVDPGETSPLKADTDGDSLPDGIEDANHDGVVDADETSASNPDSDSDGCVDGREDRNFNGRVDPGESNPRVPGDCTGQGFDTDDDGVPDATELATGTDPFSADTDGDRIKDGNEDRDHDGVVDPGESDPRKADTDGDGLADGVEDMNRDGVRQSNETYATSVDSDGDSCRDGAEDPNGNHVVEYGETNPLLGGDCPPAKKDRDCDGLADTVEQTVTHTSPTDADSDNDGIGDGRERGVVINPDPFFCSATDFANARDADPSAVTNPTRLDTDCDGLADGVEDANKNGRRDSGETDPAVADTDGDGLKDGLELGVTSNPDPTNCPGFAADQQPSTHTDPTEADTDGDHVPDGAEDVNGNGKVDGNELDPLAPGDATGPIQAACVVPRPIQTLSRNDSDLQLVATNDFSTVTTLRLAGKDVGVMLYDPTHKVVGFALHQVPAAASPAAQEADGRTRIGGIAPLDSALAQLFTGWDGYPAMQGWYEQTAATDLIARANAIVGAFLPGVSGTLGGSAGASGALKLQVEYLRRSANRAMIVGAIAPKALAASTMLRIDDLANGSALAQFGDAHRPVCEKLTSTTYSKVDFIWVVDNSFSMDNWHIEVGKAATAMGQQLAGAPIDWRIATIYTDTDREATRKAAPRPFTRSPEQFRVDAQPAANAYSPERGFAPINYMMQTSPAGRWLPATAAGAAEDPNKLRAGAKVVVIWLTDAREQSTTWPPNCDIPGNSCNHTDLINSYISVPATYANWSAYFQNLPGGMGKAFVAGIIPPVGTRLNAEETITPEYREVITALQGIEADMTNASATATAIQQIVTSAIGQATATRLSKPPISASLKVALAGPLVTQSGPGCNKNDLPRSREHGFDWDGASKTLVFYGDCRPSSPQTIAVSYRYWEDLTQNADGQRPPCDPPCASPLVCDPATNSCVCPANCGGCGEDEVCDPSTCSCVCPPDCGGRCSGNLTCDTSSCGCTCQQNQSCGDGFNWDEESCSCSCDLTGVECGPNEQFDPETCSCMCKANCGGCGPGFTCNPDSCACECPANVTCTEGYQLDRQACACVCDVAQLHCEELGPNYQADPGSCSCACKDDCGGCAGDERCDPSYCACRGGPN